MLILYVRTENHATAHLVFGIDESVIDALGAVAEVEDGIDLLSTVQRLG